MEALSVEVCLVEQTRSYLDRSVQKTSFTFLIDLLQQTIARYHLHTGRFVCAPGGMVQLSWVQLSHLARCFGRHHVHNYAVEIKAWQN